MSPGAPFGRFVIEERIAAGGMGEVYRAVQTSVGEFRKPLALKLLLPELADHPEVVAMFLAEGRLAARLQHPNVVQVLDVGSVEGRYYLAMELVKGISLAALGGRMKLANEKPSSALVSHVARQALEGLHHAHTAADDQGRPLELVHRDVSPGNVLLSETGEVKISDFGIAKARGHAQLTEPGVLKGKIEYMAPELLAYGAATVRSDLYALGITLYRLACGELPYVLVRENGTLQLPELRSAVPLSVRRPDLDEAVLAAIAKSLAADPAERFSSATQMRDAFPRGDFEARKAELGQLVRAHEVKPVVVPARVEAATATVAPPAEPTVLSAPEAVRRQARWPFVVGALIAAGAGAAIMLRPQPAPQLAVAAVAPQPEAGPEPEAEPEPEPEPEPEEAVPAPVTAAPHSRAAKRAAVKTLDPPALISVQALPWALVEIDGKVVGQTPLAEVVVANPRPVIRLTNPSYAPYELRPRLKPGERFKLNRNLAP